MILKLFFALIAICVLGRQILFMLAAELGRKSDLTRRIHRQPDGFQFAVMIPVLNPTDGPALGGLLRALLSQDYPANQVSIYVLTHPAAQEQLLALEQATRDKIHWLHAADAPALKDEARLLAWGSKRIIASGGQNRLFVFLKPTDIVREDFLSQIAHKGTYMTVMQGYLALKRLPDNIASRVQALSQRLFNRIDQAGRYHMGLSAQLMSSGWVIHQDVLEKVPMDRFLTAFPREYAMVLNRCGYRVHWTPNVVVYQEEFYTLATSVREALQAGCQRVALFAKQILPSLRFLVTRKEVGQNIDHCCQLLEWPHAALGTFLLLATGLAMAKVLPESQFWGYFFVSFVMLNVMTLFAARCALQDMVFYMGLMPMFYALCFVTAPFVIIWDAVMSVFQPERNAFQEANQQARTLRVISSVAGEDSKALEAPESSTNALDILTHDIHGLSATSFSVPLLGSLPAFLSEPQTVLLTHGKTIIECRIQVCLAEPESIEGVPRYRLELSHKGASFETDPYPVLGQAFDDLQQRLKQRGFSVLSCGTCAYFYNPPSLRSDNPQLEGLCLQGKTGQYPQDIQDSVHVLSPRCAHHTDLASRETIIEQWKASLSQEEDRAFYAAASTHQAESLSNTP